MTIVDTHAYIEFIVSKTKLEYFVPDEIDMNLHRAQMSVFDIYYQDVMKDQFVHDALNPFISTANFDTLSTAGGRIEMPADYLFSTGLTRWSYDNDTQRTFNREVRLVKQAQLNDALNSQVEPVTPDAPVVKSTGRLTMQIYPKAPNQIEVEYLRLPPTPKFNYTQTGRVVTYISTGSQDLLWAENYCNIIMNEALGRLGVNMQDPGLIQYIQGETIASLNTKKKL